MACSQASSLVAASPGVPARTGDSSPESVPAGRAAAPGDGSRPHRITVSTFDHALNTQAGP
ncbi:hypothetical protein, partial [Streptomyces microflavus]